MSDTYQSENELSTSALAKALGKNSQDLFRQLAEMGLITRVGDTWELTSSGELKGGSYREGQKYGKYGKYIVWPETFKAELGNTQPDSGQPLLTATALGKHFEISANRTNNILSELGWIRRGLKGWLVTDLGRKLGGVQSKDKTSGVPYVRWPEMITRNKVLVANMQEVKGTTPTEVQNHDDKEEIEFREKFPTDHRATDGHRVRSKAELLIDNWLYMAEVVHAYERRLPIEEEVYCDFYVPAGKVYIEYWGYGYDPKYRSRKDKKLEIYRKHGLQLIQLGDKEVLNLDDTLPRLLLQFGVKTD